MPKLEITMAELMDSYDWAEVFADRSSGNTTKAVNVAPPGAQVTFDPPSRADVAEIIAAVNGENDEEEWVGVFRLKDGRYLIAAGSCDYTGWDCQAGNSLTVCANMADVLQFGLDERQRARLDLTAPDRGE